ncbi:MAG: PIG-L family deacetylase [Nanoarchaeota archaeon]|nr:PIG-L family deacetylase [Nanoarchaeota archaeon]MBU0962594.1 PIG-L family deacetylase [Nanoarchaeota archaeon]
MIKQEIIDINNKENILIFCAHPDDEILGCGSSTAVFSDEGKDVISVIFSYGELSHLKEEIIKKKRIRESEKASKMIGSKEIIFLGLPDSKIASRIEELNIKEKIKELIKQYKPIKIFTHNPSDPLPDHKTVNEIVTNTIKELKMDIPLYGFDIWNLYNLKERERPLYYVDISKTFWTKIRALSIFKSQLHIMLYFLPIVFLRAKMAGRKNHCKYAERFYKLI